MAYVPFTNDYSSLRTPQYVAAEYAKRTAEQSRVNDIITQGNAVMGGLIADCCSDPAYGGQGFYDDSPGAPAYDPMSVLPAPGTPYPLTPVDILTGSYGFPVRRDGRPWPRPRLPGSVRNKWVKAFPNINPSTAQALTGLVPPCPCFSNAPPIPIAVPAIAAAPTPAPPPTPAAACPYPACSTGNVCLDLVTGCVLNSQVDPAQQMACALANYGVFGNQGQWLGPVFRSCKPPQYLGTPLPNPPQADPSMRAQIAASVASRAGAGLGQVDGTNPLSGIGGLLAVVGMFGIVVWATRK